MWNWIHQAEKLRAEGQAFVVATISSVVGSTPREIGAKMIVLKNGQFYGTVGGGNFERLVIQEAVKILEGKERRLAEVIKYPLGAKTGQCCGGIAEVLFEAINTGPHLYLFGAGHVGQAVCKSLSGSIFTIHAIDERAEWIHAPGMPGDVIRHEMCGTEFISTECEWSEQNTYAVVMTHRHDLDQEIIHQIIDRPARYIGLIGSQSKWKRFQQRLALRGVSETSLARVKSPIGLPLGGKAPQEIAISLAAELLQVYYSKSSSRGVPLKNLAD